MYVKLFKAAVFCLLVSFIITTISCSTIESTNSSSKLTENHNSLVLEKSWGIDVCRMNLSAVGYMLDFRFKVVDPNKAAPLLSRNTEPYIIDEKSGTKLIVPKPPKVGALRQKADKPLKNKIYYVMFANPGRLIKQEDRVTVVIGDFKAQHLIVE